MSEKKASGGNKSGLIASLGAIVLAVLGWLYGLSQNIIETFKTIFNGSYGTTTQLASNSDFAAGSASVQPDNTAMLIIAGALILLTLLGLLGIVKLLKGLFKKKED